MTTRQRSLLLAAGALGLGASGASSYVHYQLVSNPSYASFCDVNATVSCTETYLSQYGSFLGMPVALLGVLFFAAILALVGVGGQVGSPARESVPGYVFAASTIGLAFVLYLAWASFFVLGAFCILCVISYAAVIALFIISGGATPFPMTTLPGRAARDSRALFSSPTGLIVVLLLLGGVGSMIGLFPREEAVAQAVAVQDLPPLSEQDRTQLAAWWDVQPRLDIPVDAEGAPVLIVKFSDYMCPGCRIAHQSYKGVVDKYTASGDVTHVLKHYPLEPECNAHVPGGNHFASCEGAAAEVMAREKGTADAVNEWLFANQSALSPATVKQAAREVGRIEDFDGKYAEALKTVRADTELGAKLEVRSTPTLFINGRRVGGGVPPANVLDYLIQLELQRAK
ncbi:MAG: thioredoxin domain-containing protein [Acidobacteria bacterium]|nr:thioredoxin domain-containing protein [Acidobacteriota bacterium]